MAWLGHFDPRRLLMVLWVCGLYGVVAPALAAEPLLARVIAVEVDRVTLAVEQRQLNVDMDGRRIPSGVEPGKWVRVWPASADAEGSGQQGARLAPLSAIGRDRTGVRARLMRGAGRGVSRGRGRGGY